MGSIKRVPDFLVHRFLTAGAVNGLAPAGGSMTDTEETVARGRYRKFSNLLSGGLVSLDPSIDHLGFRVQKVMASLPGLTNVTFYIQDLNGNNVCAGVLSLSGGNGFFNYGPDGLVVPPGCSFLVVGTGTLSSDGEFALELGQGWSASAFDDAPMLGTSSSPPGQQH